MKCEIVSNSRRECVGIDYDNYRRTKRTFVYIPFTGEEAELFAKNMVNPAWRIEVKRNA